VDGERKVVEADLGPVRYLATLIGTTDEVAMRYFILVVALPGRGLVVASGHLAPHCSMAVQQENKVRSGNILM